MVEEMSEEEVKEEIKMTPLTPDEVKKEIDYHDYEHINTYTGKKSKYDTIEGEPDHEGDSEDMVILDIPDPLDKKVIKHHFSLDGYLKSNLDFLKHAVVKKNYDGFIVIAGREGFGKSTLAGQIAVYLDPTYNLDRCCFTADQFIEAAEGAEKFQAIVFDETMGYLSSRGAMSSFNRDLIKIFSEMRSKNLFIILCIPNFFELDRYPAMHRSTGLLYIFKRGRFGSYDYNTKKKLYLIGKKYYSYNVPPNFRGNFFKYFPLNQEAYDQKKQNAIRSFNRRKKDKKSLENQENQVD